MGRKHRRKERTRQTHRLYEILRWPEKEGIEEEVLECIQKGADLKRWYHPRGIGLPIWRAIFFAHRPSVIKILMDYGGLGEDIRIPNQQTWSMCEVEIIYDLTLEWIISQRYGRLNYPEEYENEENFEYYKEYIDGVKRTREAYEEYKQLFDIERFDLKLIEKTGYYNHWDPKSPIYTEPF